MLLSCAAFGQVSCATDAAEPGDLADGDADSDVDADGGGTDCDPADHQTPFPQVGWTEEGPAYEECEKDFLSGCVGVECADSPEAEELIRRFREAVAAEGYEDRIEVIEASYDPDITDGEAPDELPFYSVKGVAVVDWFHCRVVYDRKGSAELPSVDELRNALPDLPDAMPAYADVLAEVRACDPQGEPALCRSTCRSLEATAGGCGQMILWWNSEEPAGYTPECNPSSGEACCASAE